MKTLHSTDLEGLKQFFFSLSYKALYIFSKQVLSLVNEEGRKQYHKIVKQDLFEKLVHEITLDEYLPKVITKI